MALTGLPFLLFFLKLGQENLYYLFHLHSPRPFYQQPVAGRHQAMDLGGYFLVAAGLGVEAVWIAIAVSTAAKGVLLGAFYLARYGRG